MVFRRDSKAGDAFQRQINALRQQLGGDEYSETDLSALPPDSTIESVTMIEEEYSAPRAEYGEDFPSYGRDRFGFEQVEAEIVEAPLAGEPGIPVMPVVDGQTTVLSQNAAWKGEITSEGSMHILGRFEGQIRARDDVFILEEATVEAAIAAGTVIISGRYSGTVSCGDRLEVLPTGRVKGEVFAPTLVVHNGAVINGNVKMTSAAPAEQAVPTAVHRRNARGSA